jgi:hypothetical protein
MLDRMPSEVLSMIITDACVDGGKIGCALSLVSQSVRESTAPYRYHSVALLGWRKIQSFLDTLNKAGRIFFVRHLFVATSSGDDTNRPNTRSLARQANARSKTWDGPAPPNDERKAIELITLLFSAVANTLWSLSGFALPAVVPKDMPRLCKLILHYSEDGDTALRIRLGGMRDEIPTSPLPHLRLIRLLGKAANELCAKLSLRSPNLDVLACVYPGTLIDDPVKLLVQARDDPMFPSSLQKVYLEPTPGFTYLPIQLANLLQRRHLSAVKQASSNCPSLSDIIEILDRPNRKSLTAQRMLNGWLHAIAGSDDMWQLGDSTPCMDDESFE